MADLETLQQFADDHDFGLTAPLTHAQVAQLAASGCRRCGSTGTSGSTR